MRGYIFLFKPDKCDPIEWGNILWPIIEDKVSSNLDNNSRDQHNNCLNLIVYRLRLRERIKCKNKWLGVVQRRTAGKLPLVIVANDRELVRNLLMQ